jgi:hypothetical protein
MLALYPVSDWNTLLVVDEHSIQPSLWALYVRNSSHSPSCLFYARGIQCPNPNNAALLFGNSRGSFAAFW